MEGYIVEKFIERIASWYEVNDDSITIEELTHIWNESDQTKEDFLDRINEEYSIPLAHLYEIWESIENSLVYTN